MNLKTQVERITTDSKGSVLLPELVRIALAAENHSGFFNAALERIQISIEGMNSIFVVRGIKGTWAGFGLKRAKQKMLCRLKFCQMPWTAVRSRNVHHGLLRRWIFRPTLVVS